MEETKPYRFVSEFAAMVEARRLASFRNDDNLLAVYASSKIKVLPYQIAAARFALRSKLIKGCILCDEGSLGKTYEALLVVAQRWYEGKEHILVVIPANLTAQWQQKLDEEFTLPVIKLEEYTADSKGICLVTYDDVIREAEKIKSIRWDLAVFDEADFLFKPDNKSVIAIKDAVGDAFKLLLTPTPITMSIMDIYGLIHFIDESVLPDADSFYRRYFRKPENYPELSNWVSQFAFRTLKSQASQYVNFTRRLPVVLNYVPKDDEKKIYILTEKYLNLPEKQAYPQMDNYQLTLMFYHILASSPQAFASMLNAPIERTYGDERVILESMRDMAAKITQTAKMEELLKAIKTTFAHLKSRKETQKAIVFVDNLATVPVLADLLTTAGYSVIKHTEKDALPRFRAEKDLQILICNDAMAKGLDIEYCPVVVNYDLLYNAVEMEQRICRCHRQGQQSDVLVINLLSKENISDVRILELINKRTLQFEGIFGMSDDIVGNFDVKLEDVLQKRRALSDIRTDMETNLETNREPNERIVSAAESSLFTTFTKDIAEKVSVSPKYIEEQAEFLNKDLWEVVKFYFATKHPEYVIDDYNQTLTLPDDKELPHLFYYNTGSRNKPYTGRRTYGMSKDFKPIASRITFTSPLVRGILGELACADKAEIKTAESVEACNLKFYNVLLCNSRRQYLAEYDILTGKTINGRLMTEEECHKVINLPIKEFNAEEKNNPYWLKTADGTSRDLLDTRIQRDLKERYIKENTGKFDADVDLIKIKASRQKSALEQNISEARQDVKKIRETLSTASDRLSELKIQKELNVAEKELKKKEEGLFLDQARIDIATEDEIDNIRGTDGIEFKLYQIFDIDIS
ncbi:MAG: DEAD/DEAH box helicase [Alphaproteobacteria bacterium]|nr:DEAD/DEAH box helicase [Alphaproteobacteria bacterium]